MKLISIDIETTGVDPERDQIIEFAAVAFDPQPEIADSDGNVKRGRETWDTFEGLIRYDRITGSPFALQMNHEILAEIAGAKETYRTIYPDAESLLIEFKQFLIKHQDGTDHLHPAGKNFCNFDLQFLKRIPGWDDMPLRRRCLDVGSLVFNPNDGEIRNLKKCLEVVGIRKEISHRAIDDAFDVATIVSRFFAG